MIIEHQIFHSKNRKGEYLKYLKLSPKNPKNILPVIIHIHGAGGRGDDLKLFSLDSGFLGNVMSLDEDIDSFIVMPQCHADTWFELYDVLIEFIDALRNNPEIDVERVYLTGASMGGYTSWQLAMTRPDWFAALVPICGGGMYWNAGRLKNLPIWAFHGALDKIVLPEESIHMVAAVNNSGGNAKLTIFPNADHNAWDPTWQTKELYEWLFKQKREKL